MENTNYDPSMINQMKIMIYKLYKLMINIVLLLFVAHWHRVNNICLL